MDDMESKLGAILGNPEMMEQIMSLAQNFNQSQGASNNPSPPGPAQETGGGFSMGMPDMAMLQKLSGFASQSNIDNNQRSLLRALTPYLSSQRIYKLEKAMRAAKLAGIATKFLGNSQDFQGR